MDTGLAVAALAVLAQEKRLGTLRLLIEQGEFGLAAGEIASRLDVARATLSFHLRELAHVGLVQSCQAIRSIYCSANFDIMRSLINFVTAHCRTGDSAGCAISSVAEQTDKIFDGTCKEKA